MASARIGSLTTLRGVHRPRLHHRGSERYQYSSHKHLGYLAVVGIAVGMVALACFYLCVWLLHHSRQQPPSPSQSRLRGDGARGLSDPRNGRRAPPGAGAGEDDPATSSEDEVVKRALGGGGESVNQTWSSESVELVLMAGELVPTFVAHPQANVC